MHRLFIAIDLPPEIKDKMEGLCHGIPGAKWAPREQMHLTLKFIGEVDGSVMQDIADALSEIQSPPFEMILSGAGHFPPKQDPKIIWAGVEKNEKLENLQKKIERSLIQTGIEPDKRKFHAHITLARLNNAPLSRVSQYLAELSLFKAGPVPVTEFVLYKSHLSAKGSVYEQLAVFELIS